jgi:hypothetical protein
MSRGRTYMSREQLVATIRERFDAMEKKEDAGGKRKPDLVEPPNSREEVEAVAARDDPRRREELPVVQKRPRARPVPAKPVGVSRTCSWCARSTPKPLPAITLEHRRSAMYSKMFLCAGCVGPRSTAWRMFCRPEAA